MDNKRKGGLRMKISELISQANVTISVSAADLREFAHSVLDEYRASQQDAGKGEERMTIKQAAAYLNKSVPTLWRWQKSGYLKPDGQIGKNPYYLRESLNKIGKG